MIRAAGIACALVALVLLWGGQAEGGKAVKNQMVKGTIKLVDTSKDLLVINQKVKKEVVDRELSILESTEFVIMGKDGKQEAVGAAGLKLLEGKEGSSVQIKCDKDVNVLKVTVKLKK